MSRDTLPEMHPPAFATNAGEAAQQEPARDTAREVPPAVARPAVPPAPAPIQPIPLGGSIAPMKAKAVDAGRKVGVAVAGAGRKTLTAVLAGARTAGVRLGPALVRAGALLLAFARATARALGGLFGGVHKKWRRSHLPQTYSDVVGRAQRPPSNRMAWVHRAAVLMGVVGVGLAVWGIVGSRSAAGRTTGERPAAQLPAGTPATAPAEPLPDVPSEWPAAGELPPPAAEPSAAAPSAEPPAPPRESGQVAAGQAVAGADPARAGRRDERGASAPAVAAGGRTFTLRLDKPALRVNDYGLRQPPGIVIDVLGAGPEGGGTVVESGSNAVRLVKAVPREEGTRFIVYLRSRAMPRYTLQTNGTEIQVTILE
jgi:hypothetical protein